MNNSSSSDEHVSNLTQDMTTIISVFVCYIISTWTMFVNGMLLYCFYRNRKAVWIQRAKGMISLICTDFLTGVNSIVFLSMQALLSSVDVYSCMIFSGGYLTTQVMMSLQILRLCVQRLVAVLSKQRRTTESMKSAAFQYIVLELISIGCVSVQFVWIQWKMAYTPCNLFTLFGENMSTVCLYLVLVFTIPNTSTTLIYCYVIYSLKSMGRIFPVTETNTSHENNSQIRSAEGPIARAGSKTLQLGRYSRKAVTTIGCILLLNNITLAPYSILLSLQSRSSDPRKFPSSLWIVSVLFLQINSALSPFVYGFRLQPFRDAFAKMLKEIFCCMKRSMRSED